MIMDSNQCFSFYGNYNVKPIKEILENSTLDWTKFQNRQKACSDMRYTQTIPIIFDKRFMNTNYNPIFTENYEFFEVELNRISEIISEKTNGKGYLLRAMLVKLFKNSEIPKHVDIANETFKYSRRIHIPIETNPDCIFTVGNESINMKEGEIWEMNNDKLEHSVVNNGYEDRVHLIIDCCEKPLPK